MSSTTAATNASSRSAISFIEGVGVICTRPLRGSTSRAPSKVLRNAGRKLVELYGKKSEHRAGTLATPSSVSINGVIRGLRNDAKQYSKRRIMTRILTIPLTSLGYFVEIPFARRASENIDRLFTTASCRGNSGGQKANGGGLHRLRLTASTDD